MKRNIQKEILVKLLSSSALKYSEARPADVENDLYNYHLQFLVQKNLIDKTNNHYSLSETGKKHILDTEPLSPLGHTADKFKLNVLTILTRENNGKKEVLNQTRKRHPFFGRKGIMGGTIRKGESVLAAARRKLNDETGLDAEFKLLGLVRKFTLDKNHELVSDILYHTCLSTLYSGELKETIYSSNYWETIDATIANELNEKARIHKITDILEEIKENRLEESLFYTEEKQILEIY